MFKNKVLTIASIMVVVLLITSCTHTTSNTTTSDKVFATVGNIKIDENYINPKVTEVLANKKGKVAFEQDPVKLAQAMVVQAIDHYILQAAAKSENITVATSETASREKSIFASQVEADAVAESGIAPSLAKQVVADTILQDKLIAKLSSTYAPTDAELQKLYASTKTSYEQVHISHILVATKETAQKLYTLVKKDPASMASLAKKYSSDSGSNKLGGDLGWQPKGTLVEPLNTDVFKASINATLLVQTVYGWHIVRVLGRRTLTFSQAKKDLDLKLIQQYGSKQLSALLIKTSKEIKVLVDKSLGVWNPNTGTIDPIVSDNVPFPSTSPSK